MTLKERIAAEIKFYALLLLKDMMESGNPLVIQYFSKKTSERLYKIINPHHGEYNEKVMINCL